MQRSYLALALSCLLSWGCSTVTISSRDNFKAGGNPTYESSKPFFLAGLVGQQDIDVTEPCGGSTPLQVQTQQTFVDALLQVITFSIYAPRTVRIWCR